MSWEREALKEMISLAIDGDKRYEEFLHTLSSLGIEVELPSAGFNILKAVTDDRLFTEYIGDVHDGKISKDEFISRCLAHIENKYS